MNIIDELLRVGSCFRYQTDCYGKIKEITHKDVYFEWIDLSDGTRESDWHDLNGTIDWFLERSNDIVVIDDTQFQLLIP